MITRLAVAILRWAFVPSRPALRRSHGHERGSVLVGARDIRGDRAAGLADPARAVMRVMEFAQAFLAVWWLAVVVAIGIGSTLFVGAVRSWTADGDPALHLRLIKDIAATGRLPTELPYLAARVGDGGVIEQTFPYAYTPLYHVVAAGFFAVAGIHGVFVLNALAAAVISFVIYRMVCRRVSAPLAALCAAAIWLPPTMHRPFMGIYMEPLMLAFIATGGWLSYTASVTRSWRTAALAGVMLGLGVATRQSALVHVAVVLLVVGIQMGLRGGWRRARWRREVPWLTALGGGVLCAAAPGLLYLMNVNGAIGYADIAIPGTGSPVALDPGASAYMASITKPQSSLADWLDRYGLFLFYARRWLPDWIAMFPAVAGAIGCGFLYARGGAARFLASWILVELVAEVGLFLTLHGNDRYVMFSIGMFYATVPAGAYAVIRAVARASRRPEAVTVTACAVVVAAMFSLIPLGSWDVYARAGDRELREFRARSYAEAGAWVNEHTPPNSLFLVPRTYTAELTWNRTVTWVTYYGNAWVVDAISASDPATAHGLLTAHGVDYVVIQNPPGTYVDRMPVDGVRSFLQLGAPQTPYFTLVFQTTHSILASNGQELNAGIRIYQVNSLRQELQ